ncbi:MAG: hypothetical protein IJ087_03925, partial [Eggerthellaceae bacterium]|nr:hypothetical protein [Eggerthellaceae bacterium]
AGSVASNTSENTAAQDSNEGAGDVDDGGDEVAQDDGDDGAAVGDDTEAGDGDDADDGGYNPSGNVDKDLTSDFVDPPAVDSIAAFGNAAILVQMIGGEGALAASDADLLDSAFSSVFADEGASAIARGWSADGADSGTINTSVVIASGASAVLVYAGDYLSDAEKAALKQANVQVCLIYPMTNTTYIKKDAKTIGDMLAQSKKVAPGWDSAGMAASYVTFFDDLVQAACAKANGSATTLAGTATYELKNATPYGYNSSAKYTLLLDGYDTSARYSADIDGWTPDSNGAALATVGYATTPASFYIQAGGLVNTAAYKSGGEAGQIVAWQFNSNDAPFSKSEWDYSSGGSVDKSLDVSVNMAGAWDKSLFTSFKTTSSSADGTFAIEGSFGTSSFPKVIAATQRVKDKLIENSAKASGIYHPYKLVSKTEAIKIAFFGHFTSGGSQVRSSIGVSYDESASGEQVFSTGSGDKDAAIPDSAVVVNPCGLFSSWTEGGSPESVLEAAWVNDVVNADSAPIGWRDYVSSFYETFYRYD